MKLVKFALLPLFLLTLMLPLVMSLPSQAAAFNGNLIIDDSTFDNANAMNAGQIDAFLNSLSGSCLSTNNGFSAPDPTGYTPNGGYTYGGAVSAGQVIADAAQTYGINPQVLLTTLQKEQSLVNGAAGCGASRYAKAVGYGCPDSGGSYSYSYGNGGNLLTPLYYSHGAAVNAPSGTICVNGPAKVGFSEQVIHAAWMLKFHEERSEGNIGWAIVKGNWDNSDDLSSCFSGRMTQGTYKICPSGNATYYDGYATIDGTSVHLDSGATAALYDYTPHFSGNQNFVNIFTSYFGSTTGSLVRTLNSPTIYYSDGTNRFTLQSMELAAQYGFSTNDVRFISQAAIDAIPLAGTPYTQALGDFVKSSSDSDSDGGNVYLISKGYRYTIPSTAVLTDFGNPTLSYLPLTDILRIPGAQQPLSNYLQAPTNTVYQATSGQTHAIFNLSTLNSLNPGGNVSGVSWYTINELAPAAPSESGTYSVIGPDSAVRVYTGSSYTAVTSIDAYNCLNIANIPNYPIATYSGVGGSYSSSVATCLVNDSTGNKYIVNGSAKYNLPGNNVSTNTVPNSLLSGLASASLQPVVKSTSSNELDVLENNSLRPLPSMSVFAALGYNAGNISTIPSAAYNYLPRGASKFAVGSLLIESNGDISIVNGTNSRYRISTMKNFNDYGFKATDALALNSNDATAYTTSGVLPSYIHVGSNNYLIDAGNSWIIPAGLNSNIGLSGNLPVVDPALIANTSSGILTQFIKSTGDSTVYMLSQGSKKPINSWQAYLANSNNASIPITSLSAPVVNSFSTGSAVN